MNVTDLTLEEVNVLLGQTAELTESPESVKLVKSPITGGSLNKSLLERFITKYNLGGASESVTWVSDDMGLTTKFAGTDNNVMGFITAKNIKMEHGSFNIFETALLMNLLKVLDEEITIKVKTERNIPMAFAITDGRTKVTAVLADPRAIPVVPALKGVPPWDVVINLDPKFTITYIKAKGALNSTEKFTVMVDEKSPLVILGYEADHNSNCVNIAATGTVTNVIPATHFDADYLKNILLANKEATSGTMSVSRHGLAHLNFVVDDFVVDYYLVGKK